MKYLLNIIYAVALIFYSPILIYRMVFQGRYRTGWKWRFGNVQRKNPDSKCIWIHAVSVGEVNAVKTLVDSLSKNLETYEIIISTTTDTGLSRAESLYGDNHTVFIFPFDFSWAIKRVFENLRPSLCILTELELWPNFICHAHKKNIPVIVANGRISDKSFPSYKKIKLLVKPVFSKLSRVLAQTDEYATRFIFLGCSNEKVSISSSLKYDTAQISNNVEGAGEVYNKLSLVGKRLIVAGGTGPGEEKIVLDVFKRLVSDRIDDNLRLAIVPRKPERFNEVAELLKGYGLNFVHYSQYKESYTPCRERYDIILVDTMGDLRKFYSLCEIAFAGRSLVDMGGSDMIESAALAKTTIFGPYTYNFKQSVDALLRGHGAIEVKDGDSLYRSIKRCLLDREYAEEFAFHGRQVVINNKGATQKTLDAIKDILSCRKFS